MRRKIPTIMEALDTLDESTARTLRSAPLLRRILASPDDSRIRSMTVSHRLRPHHHSRVDSRRAPFRLPATVGNPDLAVLRPENQHQTHVLPLIAALAAGLFREQLVVLGRQLPAQRLRRGIGANVSTGERNALVSALAMALCAEGTQNIEAPVDWRIHPRQPFMRRIALCDVRGLLPRVVFEVRCFCVGRPRWLEEGPEPVEGSLSRSGTSYSYLSVRTMQRGATLPCHFQGYPSPLLEMHDLRIISGTFPLSCAVCRVPCMTAELRFGRIIHINAEDERVHVQWFDHAPNTFLDEIADSRELFLTPLCDTLPLITLCGTIQVVDMSSVTTVRDDFDGYYVR
jgi:hypothetical protein